MRQRTRDSIIRWLVPALLFLAVVALGVSAGQTIAAKHQQEDRNAQLVRLQATVCELAGAHDIQLADCP